MDAQDLGIYATPTSDGRAGEVYLAQQASFKYDFLLATLEDFQQEAWYALGAGWHDLDEEELAQHGEEEITITVPRTRQVHEA